MIHPLALVGEPPESRDWNPEMALFPPEIHPTATIGALATVDAGMFEPTRIGARSWLFKHSHAGHDSQIGTDCELAPGTVIGGHVKVGNGVRFGVNACVRPFIEIGDGARIGAGAVVVKNVPAGEVWIGNPARKLEKRTPPFDQAAAWEEWADARERQKVTHDELARYYA